MPSLGNIFVNPRAHATGAPAGPGGARVRVEGLVCSSICARRVRASLLRLPGVVKVDFDPMMDTFQVSGTRVLSAEELERAAVAPVALRWGRVLLEWLARPFRRAGRRSC